MQCVALPQYLNDLNAHYNYLTTYCNTPHSVYYSIRSLHYFNVFVTFLHYLLYCLFLFLFLYLFQERQHRSVTNMLQ